MNDKANDTQKKDKLLGRQHIAETRRQCGKIEGLEGLTEDQIPISPQSHFTLVEIKRSFLFPFQLSNPLLHLLHLLAHACDLLF